MVEHWVSLLVLFDLTSSLLVSRLVVLKAVRLVELGNKGWSVVVVEHLLQPLGVNLLVALVDDGKGSGPGGLVGLGAACLLEVLDWSKDGGVLKSLLQWCLIFLHFGICIIEIII